MKKAVALLALLSLLGCAGKQYKRTEGPFRAKFAKPYSFAMVNQVWQMPIFFDGELPNGPVHVEGYLVNNGSEYLEAHSDLPEIRVRVYSVFKQFSEINYCEAVGRPLDRFDADKDFFSRGENQGDPSDFLATPPEDAADGSVEIRFVFHELKQDSHGNWIPGKILTEVKTEVKLECPQCLCGSRLI